MPQLEELDFGIDPNDPNDSPYPISAPFLRKSFPSLRKLRLDDWAFVCAEILESFEVQTELHTATFIFCSCYELGDGAAPLSLDEYSQRVTNTCSIDQVVVKGDREALKGLTRKLIQAF